MMHIPPIETLSVIFFCCSCLLLFSKKGIYSAAELYSFYREQSGVLLRIKDRLNLVAAL